MKVNKKFTSREISLLLLIILAFSCRKITTNKFIPIRQISTVDTSNNTPVVSASKPPVAFAGNNIIIQLPLDSVFLNGSYTAENSFHRAEWKKLMGPACLIENQDALSTKVTRLQTGTYHFVLTVYDALNSSGRDTVAVSVLPPRSSTTSNYVIFNNLSWKPIWYNSIEVPNIYSYVPMGKPFKVFVQRDGNTNWVEAQSASDNLNTEYEYFIETRWDGAGMYTFGSLYIFYYGANTSDTPNVKVEF